LPAAAIAAIGGVPHLEHPPVDARVRIDPSPRGSGGDLSSFGIKNDLAH
jgi:hypothetical protein